MAQTPEGRVKDQVKKALHANGIHPFAKIAQGMHPEAVGTYWMPVQGQFSVNGVHDFVICLEGVFCSLETKSPENPSDETMHQGWFRVAVTQSGGISLTGVRDGAQAVAKMIALVQEKLDAYKT
jgi:hypothetical protein